MKLGFVINDVGTENPAYTTVRLATAAHNDRGMDELLEAIGRHRTTLEATGALEERRRRNLAAEVLAVASARARRHLEDAVAGDPELGRLLARVERRELDPLTAVRTILRTVFHVPDDDGEATRDGDQDSPDAR